MHEEDYIEENDIAVQCADDEDDYAYLDEVSDGCHSEYWLC